MSSVSKPPSSVSASSSQQLLKFDELKDAKLSETTARQIVQFVLNPGGEITDQERDNLIQKWNVCAEKILKVGSFGDYGQFNNVYKSVLLLLTGENYESNKLTLLDQAKDFLIATSKNPSAVNVKRRSVATAIVDALDSKGVDLTQQDKFDSRKESSSSSSSSASSSSSSSALAQPKQAVQQQSQQVSSVQTFEERFSEDAGTSIADLLKLLGLEAQQFDALTSEELKKIVVLATQDNASMLSSGELGLLSKLRKCVEEETVSTTLKSLAQDSNNVSLLYEILRRARMAQYTEDLGVWKLV